MDAKLRTARFLSNKPPGAEAPALLLLLSVGLVFFLSHIHRVMINIQSVLLPDCIGDSFKVSHVTLILWFFRKSAGAFRGIMHLFFIVWTGSSGSLGAAGKIRHDKREEKKLFNNLIVIYLSVRHVRLEVPF